MSPRQAPANTVIALLRRAAGPDHLRRLRQRQRLGRSCARTSPARRCPARSRVAVSPNDVRLRRCRLLEHGHAFLRRAAGPDHLRRLRQRRRLWRLSAPTSPASSLNGPLGVAVTPDANSVYVASFDLQRGHAFHGGSGRARITQESCYANDASGGCVSVPDTPLTGARSVAVSPDGRSVYVVSGKTANSISYFGVTRRESSHSRLPGQHRRRWLHRPAGQPAAIAVGVAVSPDNSPYTSPGVLGLDPALSRPRRQRQRRHGDPGEPRRQVRR